MRGKKMVEMCTNHTYVRLQDADVVSEESTLNFDSLINQAEIVFEDELSNLGLTPNGNLRSDLPDTSSILSSIENILNNDSCSTPKYDVPDPRLQLPNQIFHSSNDLELSLDESSGNALLDTHILPSIENITEDCCNTSSEILVPSNIEGDIGRSLSNSDRSSENDQPEIEKSISSSRFKSKRKINKELRMRGKTYTGFRRPKQQKRTFQDVERNERILGPTCSSEVCKKSSKRRCHEITEASRREIFKQRKVYVSNLVSKREKMRATKSENDPSRRSSSLFYNLNIDGQIVPVCKNMFLKTLAVKEWSVRNWVEKSKYGIVPNVTRTDRRFSSTTQNDKVISTFLDKLPKIPSHYCRKDTKKMYLEQDFSSYSDLKHITREQKHSH
nr:unnamed protein product [Callosobruchus chinensis]